MVSCQQDKQQQDQAHADLEQAHGKLQIFALPGHRVGKQRGNNDQHCSNHQKARDQHQGCFVF